MPSTLAIVPTVSLPKKSNKPITMTNPNVAVAAISDTVTSNNKKTLSLPKKSTSSPSTSKRQRKPKTKQKTLALAYDTSSPSSQTESDDTDKSTNTQKNQQQQQSRRRRRHPKKSNAQSKLQENMPSSPANIKRRRRSNSAVIYAGPHFMNDAPAPSSLPLPGSLITPTQSIPSHPEKKQQHQQQQLPLYEQHRPTLYERSLAGDYKSYLMDPISEIQEKVRIILRIRA
ncbi:hypothetical protein BC941DRAFT_412764 [Chlamydoabsidia padenii]|nr:hypothetical protein BC941DRAFT_412764 [Chlamydoabsidia padenii]